MLVTSLLNTVKQVIPKRQFKCHLKPYWTNDLTRLNKSMKEVRIEWLHHGCPRHGNVFTRLKTAKRFFRNVHRKTVELYFVHEIDKAAEINQSQFWRLVNAKRNVSERCPGSEFIFNSRVCRDTDSIVTILTNILKKRFHQRLLHFILIELPLTRAYVIPAFLFSLLKALLNL